MLLRSFNLQHFLSEFATGNTNVAFVAAAFGLIGCPCWHISINDRLQFKCVPNPLLLCLLLLLLLWERRKEGSRQAERIVAALRFGILCATARGMHVVAFVSVCLCVCVCVVCVCARENVTNYMIFLFNIFFNILRVNFCVPKNVPGQEEVKMPARMLRRRL